MLRNVAINTLFAVGDALEIAGARLCGLAWALLHPDEPEPWLFNDNGMVDVYLDGEHLAGTARN